MLTSIVYVYNKVRWWSIGWSPLTGSLDTGAFFVSFATGFGGGFLALMRIAWTLWRGRSVPRLKRQGLIILAGALIALPVLAPQLLSPFNQAVAFYFDGLDLRYLYLAIPLAFAFTILRYQAFHAIHPLFVAALVLIGCGLLASTGDWLARRLALITASIPPGDTNAAQPSQFLPLFAVALVAAVLGLWVTGVLSRLFYWDRTSYGAAQRFGEQVMKHQDWARLPHLMTQALTAELKVEHASVWL